jgi:hypothetical protein
MSYYLIGQQCVLISRHTDCTDNEHWTEKSACVVSSVLGKGLQTNSLCVVSNILSNALYINNMVSRCRETWAGDGWRAWGGGVAGEQQPALD